MVPPSSPFLDPDLVLVRSTPPLQKLDYSQTILPVVVVVAQEQDSRITLIVAVVQEHCFRITHPVVVAVAVVAAVVQEQVHFQNQ